MVIAIFHLEAKPVTRGEGRSVVAAAAYISCSFIYNDYDGLPHDYSRKRGLKYERVFLPAHAPPAWKDRAILWNVVEAAEKTRDSRLAREIIVALPVELTLSQNVRLLEEYVQAQFVSDGMCADVCIHDGDGHNPHAHILLTIRPLNQNGSWQAKTEKEYLCVKNGIEQGFTAAEYRSVQKDGWEKQYLYRVGGLRRYLPPSQAAGYERLSKHPKSTPRGRQNPISQRWNSPEQLTVWRKTWAEAINKHLELAGFDVRVDYRSFKDQGIDRQPTIHEGVFAIRMERKGRRSDRCELNRRIFKDNSALAYWAETVVLLTKAVVLLIPVIANVLETIRVRLLVLLYDWKYNKVRIDEQRDEIAKMKKALPYIQPTIDTLAQKQNEKAALEKELQHTPGLFKKRRKAIETQLFGLTEEISEWMTEHDRLSQLAGSSVAFAQQRIKTAEERLGQLEALSKQLDDAIDEAVETFKAKEKEAASLDQEKLRNERLRLRPEKYAEAYDVIEKQHWICDMDCLQASQKNAAALLGEEADAQIVFPKQKSRQPTLIKHREDIER